MASRILAKITDASVYAARKASAQAGAVGGVSVSLLASDDASGHLLLECGTVADASRLIVLAEQAANVRIVGYQLKPETAAEAFARDPWAFVAGRLSA